jgi:hypothetical protein
VAKLASSKPPVNDRILRETILENELGRLVNVKLVIINFRGPNLKVIYNKRPHRVG